MPSLPHPTPPSPSASPSSSLLPSARPAPEAWSLAASPANGLLPPWAGVATAIGCRSSIDWLTARVSRAAAAGLFPGEVQTIVIAYQIHGGAVVRVTGDEAPVEPENEPARSIIPTDPLTPPGPADPLTPLAPPIPVLTAGRCDGMWTSHSGVCMVIRTADCAPVVIADEASRRLALVHSGWRGTLANILGAGVRRLLEAGSQPANLKIWIGPAIGSVHLEVGDEVCEAFAGRWPGWNDCWRGRRLDIQEILLRQAQEAGVPRERVTPSGICTYSAPEALPSHRREGTERLHSLYTLAVLRENDAWK